MSDLQIEQFPARTDNYGVLVHDPAAGLTAAIDAPEEQAILAALKRRGWKLTHILTTHHHNDHVEANLALKQRFGIEIIGPEAEKASIPGIDRTVKDGDQFKFGNYDVKVISTPGHTAGEVSYFLPEAKVVFAGDTLFSLGCGRLFEGTPATMFRSLQKLVALPVETTVYCGHEYTESNARFALAIDPDNSALKERAREVQVLREAGLPTLPTTIMREMATNPFLRWHDPAIRRNLKLEHASDEAVFTEIRKRKDNF
ncbi:hydroxyacylglutathione hydrolase [Phyllobacterium sp. 21LDTY02-6]|uniref:hydroxyacylglutathione hydrolase n=1 Tax=Phyllobacterium sp. 21LDTY02-6 TaxID=2944903 RepID=UPI0020227A63|nr:hydroxyacylglutathione hydrolase [Phyllobacterium sp. 21LDTY02-6]MCO4317751.1 hydroxyacylglutathione hydrolase [Phyllobacterium sp. 21LDTY02-6]